MSGCGAGAEGAVLGELDELGLGAVDGLGDPGGVELGVLGGEPVLGVVVESGAVEEPLVGGAGLVVDAFLPACGGLRLTPDSGQVVVWSGGLGSRLVGLSGQVVFVL